MPDELAALDAIGQAELVRSGAVTPLELVDTAIARLERLNPQLNAVIFAALDAARDRAASGDLPDGPFRGVPFLMKDLGGTQAGRPHCAGMRCVRDGNWVEPQNSYLTDKLIGAGFVILGRTNTPELGLLPTTEPVAFGPTRNPWNLEHSPGGSSGGSAAAVAAGIVPAAHASDGGGSIRIPASMCGLVGLKPSRGRNSFGPVVGERWSGCATEFALTRSVRDAAALLDITAGAMPGDPYAAPPPALPFADAFIAPPPHLRIGVLRHAPGDFELDGECVAAVDAAARMLSQLGHRIEESHPPVLGEPAHLIEYFTIVSSNIARALQTWGDRLGRVLGPDDVEPLTWAVAERGRGMSAVELLAAVESMHSFGRALAAWWERGFNLLLTPSVGAPPPPIGFVTSTADDPFRGFMRAMPYGAFTSAFNLSGQPAISLPLHCTADGLPIGIQLVAATGREDLLLQVAAQLEVAAPWAGRMPAVHA